MKQKSLLQQSQNLSYIALDSFVSDATSSDENYNFQSLLSHSQINTIKPENINLLNLFSKGTYQQYLSQSKLLPQLSDKQVKNLKKLTILTAFEGLKVTSLFKLNNILESTTAETIQLLLEMGISDIINIKIDESKGLVNILKAETRCRKLQPSDCQAIQARIANTKYRNSLIQKGLTDLSTMIK